jgi:hypothetical protein
VNKCKTLMIISALLLASSTLAMAAPGSVPASSPLFIPMTGFRGPWLSTKDYPTGSVVSYGGVTYIAVKDQAHGRSVEPDTDTAGDTWYSLTGTYPTPPPPPPPPGPPFACPPSPITSATTLTNPLKYSWGVDSWNGTYQNVCTVTGVLSTTGPLMSAWFQVYFPTGWVIRPGEGPEDPFIQFGGSTQFGGVAPSDNTDYVFDVFLDPNLDVVTDCYGNYATGMTNQLVNLCGNVITPYLWVYVRVRAVTANPAQTPFAITFWD